MKGVANTMPASEEGSPRAPSDITPLSPIQADQSNASNTNGLGQQEVVMALRSTSVPTQHAAVSSSNVDNAIHNSPSSPFGHKGAARGGGRGNANANASFAHNTHSISNAANNNNINQSNSHALPRTKSSSYFGKSTAAKNTTTNYNSNTTDLSDRGGANESKSRFTVGGVVGGTNAGHSVANSQTSGSRATKKSQAVASVQEAAIKGYVAKNADGTAAQTARPRFTLPLSLVLFLQCSLVVVAFIAIVVVADVIANRTATNLIRHSVETELKYAATQIDGPISSIESGIVEYRSRHMAYTYINNMVEPCNQYAGGFQNSSDFYANAIQAINNNPYISHVFYVKEGHGIDPEFNMTDLNRCSASGSQFFRRFAGVSMKAARAPKLSDFANLDLIPLNPDSSTKQISQIYLGLQAKRVTWAPLSSEDPRSTDYIFVLVLSAPVHYNVTNTVTGAESTFNYLQINSTYLTDDFAAKNPHIVVRTIGIICMTIRMTNYPTIMKSITPTYDGAHSSLYDLKRDMLLATSFFDARNQLNYINGDHYEAGSTPSSELNEAFAVAKPYTLKKGEVRILFGKGNVVSAYLYVREETGVRFAFIQSTPRDNYFAPMKTLRTVMIILGVCSAVLVVIACLLVGISISIGGTAVILNMGLAAAMRNDRTIRVTSVLREIQQLSDGFDAMNDRLLEARAYLPQHMLMTSSDESDGNEEEEDNDKGAGDGGDGASRHASYTAADLATDTTFDSPTHNGLRSVNNIELRPVVAAGGGVGGGLGGGGLGLKRVTILSINARGFHTIVNINSAPSTVTEPTTSLTDLISTLSNTYKGMIDSFHGDHFVVSFNAARANAEGASKASRCALELAAAGDNTGKLFAMGISTGRACVGHLGTATLKRLSIIGPVYSRAMALERVCRRFNPSLDVDPATEDGFLPIQCVVDMPVVTEIQHSFVLQLLGGLYGSPFVAARRSVAPAVNLASLSVRYAGRRPRPDDANFVSASAFNNNMTTNSPQTNAKLKGVAGAGGASPLPPLEFIYALRKASASNKGDEWLYEISNNNTSKVNEVNRAIKEYLVEVHAAEVDNQRNRHQNQSNATAPAIHIKSQFAQVVVVDESPAPETDGVSLTTKGTGAPFLSSGKASDDINFKPWRVEATARLAHKLQRLSLEGEGGIPAQTNVFDTSLAPSKSTSPEVSGTSPAACGVGGTPVEDPLFWESLKYAMAMCGVRMPIPAFVLTPLGIISQSNLDMMNLNLISTAADPKQLISATASPLIDKGNAVQAFNVTGGGIESSSNNNTFVVSASRALDINLINVNDKTTGSQTNSPRAAQTMTAKFGRSGGRGSEEIEQQQQHQSTWMHFTGALFGLNDPISSCEAAWFDSPQCPPSNGYSISNSVAPPGFFSA